jgi:peptide/nickel transport system substrate-binding protein
MWYLFRPAHYCKQFDPKYTDRAIVDKQAKDAGFDNWYKYYSDITQWKFHPEVPCLNPWLVVTENPKDAQRIELERNPYYWKVDTEGRQLPYIDRVTFDAVASVDVALINTLNGDYDLIDYNINVMTNYTVLAENKAKGKYHFAVHKPALMNSAVVMVNHNHPDPVKNKLYNTPAFKFGLSYAMNREEINQLVYSGTTFPRQCSPSEGSPFYDEEYANLAIEYDVAKANKYLDEAGRG